MTGKAISIPVIKIIQPIGEFFIGVMSSKELVEISYADIREMESSLDTYLGIQRKLSPTRVKDLKKYVHTIDATFPTSIILAVQEECAEFDENSAILRLHDSDEVPFDRIAKILDGQHRIEGLKGYEKDDFQLNVTIFINADIADQANIFATVNLAQTKVNKSLVYDLFDLSRTRSPQKTAHDVAVALDRHESSPLNGMIKRLGFATPGRTGETLTQAAVVEGLLNYFLSPDSKADRDLLLRGKELPRATEKELEKYPFRNMFIDEKDVEITKILLAYYAAVRDKWSQAWISREQGNILPKTNGFRALLRFLRVAYVYLSKDKGIGSQVSYSEFNNLLQEIQLKNDDFTIENFPPGTSGESILLNTLLEQAKLKS